MRQSLLELFKLASPKLFMLACLAFPTETPIKVATYAFPLLLSVSWSTLVYGITSPLLSGNVSDKNLLSMALTSKCHHSVTFINDNPGTNKMGISMSYFNANSQDDFHMGISFTGLFSFVLLPNHKAGPLTTAHKSVKAQTWRQTTCNSDHWANLFLPFSIRVAGFQTRCCLLILKLPFINQEAICWSIESCSQGTVHVPTDPQMIPKPVLGQESTCLRMY